jgi:predicted nuclease of restriction endonuclease-like (RecB) superfamily
VALTYLVHALYRCQLIKTRKEKTYMKTEPITHIELYQIIKKPIALELCNLIDKISSKLSSDEKEKLIDLADYVLLKELHQS